MAIDFEQRFGFLRFAGKRTRGENTAVMRSIKRRSAIGMRLCENNAALGNHTINVIDRARNELLEQIERLLIAEMVKQRPKLFRRMNLFHADAGSLRTRLEQPGAGHSRHEPAKIVIV